MQQVSESRRKQILLESQKKFNEKFFSKKSEPKPEVAAERQTRRIVVEQTKPESETEGKEMTQNAQKKPKRVIKKDFLRRSTIKKLIRVYNEDENCIRRYLQAANYSNGGAHAIRREAIKQIEENAEKAEIYLTPSKRQVFVKCLEKDYKKLLETIEAKNRNKKEEASIQEALDQVQRINSEDFVPDQDPSAAKEASPIQESPIRIDANKTKANIKELNRLIHTVTTTISSLVRNQETMPSGSFLADEIGDEVEIQRKKLKKYQNMLDKMTVEAKQNDAYSIDYYPKSFRTKTLEQIFESLAMFDMRARLVITKEGKEVDVKTLLK